MRKQDPIELQLHALPPTLVDSEAACPKGCVQPAGAIGRLGLRLVFQCVQCAVRFYRAPQPSSIVPPGRSRSGDHHRAAL